MPKYIIPGIKYKISDCVKTYFMLIKNDEWIVDSLPADSKKVIALNSLFFT